MGIKTINIVLNLAQFH